MFLLLLLSSTLRQISAAGFLNFQTNKQDND